MSYGTRFNTEKNGRESRITCKSVSKGKRRSNDKEAIREAIKEMTDEETARQEALEQMCKELDEDLGFMDDFYINREMDAVLEAMDGGLADDDLELPFYNDEDFYYDF